MKRFIVLPVERKDIVPSAAGRQYLEEGIDDLARL